jgi:hypothetical protein
MIARLCVDVGIAMMPESMPIAIPIVPGIGPPCAACQGHAFQEWRHA